MRRFPGMVFVLLLSLGSTGTSADAPKEKDIKTDLDQLQGHWSAISATRDTKVIPEEEARKFKLRIKGDKYTLFGEKEAIEGTLTLAASKKPKHLDAVRSEGANKGKPIKGIYK